MLNQKQKFHVMLNQKQKFHVTKYEDNDLSFLLKRKEKKRKLCQIKLRMSCWSSMHLAIFTAPTKVLYNSPATFQY